MKGLYKGVKYTLSQMFVKEPQLEIGCPTDVKHVAHVGWDGPSGGNPSWMNEYETGPEFAQTSVGNPTSGLPTYSTSRDCGESKQEQSSSDMAVRCKDIPESSEIPPTKKRARRKKCKQGSCSDTGPVRQSRAAKQKVKFAENNPEPNNVEVA
ncbi:CRIB domain-containing protein RIC10-like [Andrographis paniculata]|uniref:CRIB domain-containing protein RIC10-like n=1 Tax=Andrographis paniculata TaxID=175694 RepID=UPI0021E72FC1|nr:CRIB domain-containing protein RIC10-like [Andrographis paniculata]XP_051125841.1 CRIB domain-containing protein RIC10-like [Andrographis paniculata]